MAKKIGLILITFFVTLLILLIIYHDSFGKELFIVSIVSTCSMIPFGVSLLSINSSTANRKKVKTIYLIFALTLIVFGYLSKKLHFPAGSIELIVGVLWYCFAFAPLELKHKYLKWKPFSKTPFETIFLSSIDFIGLNFLALGLLFKFQHWPFANDMIKIGALTLTLGLLFWNFKFKKEVVFRKESEDKLKEKNREILDSITYAKRIQSAILPQPKLVKEYFKDSFILYKPKDIVAGDFYWFEVIDDLIFFAAADCTGHGVPGAMVSVVCHNALNRSVKEFSLKNPADILDKTREIVVEEFERSEEDVKDGMDISLCVINLNTNLLHWAGAHNPLWILRNKEIIEYKADKQPIGKFAHAKAFTKHDIELQKEDEIYIFTDGFQDQFGGEKQKKYKVSQMRELVLALNQATMEEKRTQIDLSFENWKANLEQVDDVCVIGVRV